MLGVPYELVEVTSHGDRVSDPVDAFAQPGAFVRAVQQAVVDGRADVAVHSCKDLPTDSPLVAYHPPRSSPWDVLCGPAWEDLPRGAAVGTGSPRRRTQLLLLRPDLEVVSIRGNVDTRLDGVASRRWEAVVLAEAGLLRLGRIDAATHRFGLTEMVPAPGQGALAVEVIPGGDAEELVASIEHPPTRVAVTAERRLLALTGLGCRASLGAYAETGGEGIVLWAFVADENGPRRVEVRGEEPDQVALLAKRELGL